MMNSHRHRPMPLCVLALAAILCPCFLGTAAADDPTAWPETTTAAKPWGYWWWMGSAVDRENLRAEMEAYAATGMGGLHIIPIYGAKGAEDRYIDFLSPKWMEMMQTAVTEARRVGMDVDWSLCTGWCFGGPWIGSEDANSTLVCNVRKLETGKTVDSKFDRKTHQAVVAYGPDRQIVELTDKISDDGQIDWTVPQGVWKLYVVSQKRSSRNVKRAAPGGAGPMASPESRRAIEKHLAAFERAITENPGPLPRATYHDSYEYISNWSPEVFDLFEKNRGYRLQEHLPALMGEGDGEIVARVQHDYRETFSELHIDHFLKPWVEWSHKHGMITRNEAHGSSSNLLDAYAICDSPETEFFRDDGDELFAKLSSSAAHVAGRKYVSAETCTWRNEHFCTTLSEVRNTVCRLMTAGVNHNIFHGTCYSPEDADWPGWCFYASTQYNRRNSFWRDAAALNRYIARCQSVLQTGRPGNDVLLYWPIHDMWQQPGKFGPQKLSVHGDWFHKSSLRETAKSLWNCGIQFDYVSDRQLASSTFDEKLQRIVFPADAAADQSTLGRYHTIVLPPCRTMPLATLRQLIELARGGATVIFDDGLPTDVPGLKDHEQRRDELAKLLGTLSFTQLESEQNSKPLEVISARYGVEGEWVDVTNKVRNYIKGTEAKIPMGRQFLDDHLVGTKKTLEVTYSDSYGERLVTALDHEPLTIGQSGPLEIQIAKCGLGKLQVVSHVDNFIKAGNLRRERITDLENLELIRRYTDDGSTYYFIYNRAATDFDGELPITSKADGSPTTVVVMDPLTGRRGIGKLESGSIQLRIPAGESIILNVIYTKMTAIDAVDSGLPLWDTYKVAGNATELAGTWSVDFIIGGPELPEAYRTNKLAPWTYRTEDPETQRFAGTGRYRLTFDAPNKAAGRYRIDLGRVADSCRVTINDSEPVTLFGPSFELEGVQLRATGNTLTVEVTNVAANRIRDLDRRGVQWRKFHDINLVNIDYKPFDASDWPVRPAGLIGPVTLTPVKPRP